MASFVYNPYRSNRIFDLEENRKQWYDYLQRKSFHDDFTQTVKAEANSYKEELRNNARIASQDMDALRNEFVQASEQQLEAISWQTQAISDASDCIVGSLDEGFYSVNERLDNGFASLSSDLHNINSSIENLSLMLDWRLSHTLDQLRISNLLQRNITLLLRIPDFQKERQHYIEQGFKHYKNAMLDADLYEDALRDLLKAESLETTDYLVLHQIGMIYLYGENEDVMDLPRAEEYFRRAAKYAIVESSPNAQQALNILANLPDQVTTVVAAKAVAAKSYFHAGVACYGQGKFKEASELTAKAYSLLPPLLEAGFLQAKSLARIGECQKSADILSGVIALERLYAMKAASDADLAPQEKIQALLTQLRDSAVRQALERVLTLRNTDARNADIDVVLSYIDDLIQKNTYLDALKALDELTAERQWQVSSFKNLLQKRFSHIRYDPKATKSGRAVQFEAFPKEEGSSDILVQSYQKKHVHNVEEWVRVRKEIDDLQVHVRRDEEEAKRNAEIEKRNQERDLQRLETDRVQIRELLEQGRNCERVGDRNSAMNFFEQAAKLGSVEAGNRFQALKQKRVEEKRQRVEDLVTQGKNEEESEDGKWLFKNYTLAISYYEQAANLGSLEARERLMALRARIGSS